MITNGYLLEQSQKLILQNSKMLFYRETIGGYSKSIVPSILYIPSIKIKSVSAADSRTALASVYLSDS